MFFSNYNLFEDKKSLLALIFVLLPTNKILLIILNFEKLAYILSKSEFYKRSNDRVNEFLSIPKQITFLSLKRIIETQLHNSLTSKNLASLKSLSSNKNVFF